MAFQTSYSDSALSSDVEKDANPGANSIKYRTLLKEIDNGLGARDMEKLKYLCQDLGVAPRKFENMNRGIYLFTELEKLALVTADDISLLVLLMQAINRYDLVKKLKSWSSKEGKLAHMLSSYRRLMLRISDSLSRDERDQFKFYLSGGEIPIPVAAIEECKTLLQLFVLMEKYTLIGPGDLEYFTSIMQSIGNIAIVKEIEKYFESCSSQSFQSHQGSGAAYDPANMRSKSEPTFRVHTHIPPPDGHVYQGIPQQYQQPYYKNPPQQYHNPHQQATPSFSQQYPPQQLVHGQQMAIKREPEDRTGSEMSGLTFGPERPKWYYEAVEKHGPAYADELWEKVLQKMREGEVRKKMQEMKISEERRVEERGPSDKTQPGDDEREASVTRTLALGPIRDTKSTESLQTQTPSEGGHRIVPAQTATILQQQNPGPSPQLPKYKMDRLPRGLCIIFNAENFTGTKLEKRVGTEKDVEALRNTFQKNLRFKTLVKNDPTRQTYVDYLQEIARMDHSEYDCFVCVILSHGSKGCVYGTDGRQIQIDALTGLFRGEYVPTLLDKPKLFFIQACQGTDGQAAIDIRQDAVTSLPNESDTLLSLSTVPGYSSNRSVSKGTWFITTLCSVINSHYNKHVDLLSMLTMVNYLLSTAADKEKKKQIGNPSHTLRKQIYFNQGLGE
ncbi:uncharacterized protein LOC121422962 isoform X2 [Lytechinus variegatus]|uniref:uncharacterized protein LOC121422962 isoform X2 n=1 Tax=Lytechinus variegatus TaxID=7654 RepID=UPI001BB1B9C2|nr:uncharacterized protein LOC121422962 isoform X2 [Lytechinus variegatus]